MHSSPTMYAPRTRGVVDDLEAIVSAVPGVRRRYPAAEAEPEPHYAVRVTEEDQCLVITVRIGIDERVTPLELERRICFAISTFLAYLNHPLRPRIAVLIGAAD